MLYCVMRRRTQLYLDEEQYRWLKRQAGHNGSIAAVVRDLIDRARTRLSPSHEDPLIRYLRGKPGGRRSATSVHTLDRDLYGS